MANLVPAQNPKSDTGAAYLPHHKVRNADAPYSSPHDPRHEDAMTTSEPMLSLLAWLTAATSRGIPDISAQALRFPVIFKGERRVAFGTSGSTPIVAGIISLHNDYLISQGEVTLGFLNPWLYGTGMSGLTDITSGSNPGCNTNGFSAIEGWDPVTGLGTPDFQRLLPVLPGYAEPGGAG
ncbi:peptidase S8/S53 domain-containing protein [Lactarius pseudohatsudake]|nr:peptidase S8/S53 domain-containing protein [Lactarius pseudohatsudake]